MPAPSPIDPSSDRNHLLKKTPPPGSIPSLTAGMFGGKEDFNISQLSPEHRAKWDSAQKAVKPEPTKKKGMGSPRKAIIPGSKSPGALHSKGGDNFAPIPALPKK